MPKFSKNNTLSKQNWCVILRILIQQMIMQNYNRKYTLVNLAMM